MSVLSFNSRIGTTSNLPQGGTFDVLLMSFPDGFPQSQLIFEISNEPRKITGIQKCAQIFLKLLFTSKGSNVFYPNQGTNFSSLTVNANRVVADDVLYSELQAQILDATAQAQAILNIVGTDPASQLASITLLGLDVGDESVVMYLSLVTAAGQTASIATPFPQLDLALSP